MTHWQVETGMVGGQKQMTLLPDCDPEDLSATIEDGREVWTISGRRARFKSTAIQLPAGWYRVRGVMDCLDGGIMSPGLRAEYADINYVGARYGLSEPGEDGTLGALIMLGADVVGLTFLPGVAPATFRMHSFTLQRVSRWRALRLMLAHDRSDGSIWLTIKRSGRFLRNVLRDGVSQGGAALFGDYARRLSTRGSNDYATWIRRYERFGSGGVRCVHAHLPGGAHALAGEHNACGRWRECRRARQRRRDHHLPHGMPYGASTSSVAV